jgi:hypothetical protein
VTGEPEPLIDPSNISVRISFASKSPIWGRWLNTYTSDSPTKVVKCHISSTYISRKLNNQNHSSLLDSWLVSEPASTGALILVRAGRATDEEYDSGRRGVEIEDFASGVLLSHGVDSGWMLWS